MKYLTLNQQLNIHIMIEVSNYRYSNFWANIALKAFLIQVHNPYVVIKMSFMSKFLLINQMNNI